MNLDCSGTQENVWNQLLAIGRLMRPVAQLGNTEGNGNNNTLPFYNDEAIEDDDDDELEAQSR